MKIQASESTAIKKVVDCKNGHTFDVWYIMTPDGLVMEYGTAVDHIFVPKNAEDPAYKSGDCCFKAACELAWTLALLPM